MHIVCKPSEIFLLLSTVLVSGEDVIVVDENGVGACVMNTFSQYVPVYPGLQRHMKVALPVGIQSPSFWQGLGTQTGFIARIHKKNSIAWFTSEKLLCLV